MEQETTRRLLLGRHDTVLGKHSPLTMTGIQHGKGDSHTLLASSEQHIDG